MSQIDKDALAKLLTNGPNRSLVGGKQLTLAFAGLYIASTTLKAKPLLVWETESGYPRYYVPIESLHTAIKSELGYTQDSNANGTANGKEVKLEVIDSVEGKGNDSKALIERLTVGSRSTTWTRFVEGALMGFVRFERSEIDQWFENGALFMGIKNPYKRIDTKPVPNHIVIKVDGEEVAETNAPVILNETGLKDAYYLPATSIKDWGMVDKSDWRTQCPYKGESWYFNLTVKGKKYDNMVWYYPYPTHESSGVEGFISFYNKDNVDILVDGVKLSETQSGRVSVAGPRSEDRTPVPTNLSLDYKWEKQKSSNR